ncbi:MAG: lipopolysaccharide heptosyltransferase II [Candidatus Omnitrophota bacterium]|nr:MAG: lipopolysaccharide heptosyltransferase II [Candidatus Omnitrophota bacterium]
MERILIVNLNWRGDVLFSTPFIRALREAYPESFLATLLVRRCAPIVENSPHLDEVIIFDEDKNHKGLMGKLRLIRLLRAKHFDTVFLLHRSFTRTLICWLSGIPERIGYYTKKRARLLTKSIMPSKDEPHRIEYFLDIARSCGIKAENSGYDFFVSREDKDYIKELLHEEKLLKESDFLVVINPGGNWDLKRWPKENFSQLADRLIKECDAKVIITGAQDDLKLAQDIKAGMKNSPLILCGRTSLGQLAALMARVNLVISNDSGPMHIALSQKANVVCLFGPTSSKITGPCGNGNYTVLQKDIGCQVPCYELNCPDNRCMKAIGVDEVFQAVEKIKNG